MTNTEALISACTRAVCAVPGAPKHDEHLRFYSHPRWLYCLGTYVPAREGEKIQVDLSTAMLWHTCSAYPAGHAGPVIQTGGHCDLSGVQVTAELEQEDE